MAPAALWSQARTPFGIAHGGWSCGDRHKDVRKTTMFQLKSLCLTALFCAASATAFAQTAAPAKDVAAAASPAVTAPATTPTSAKKAAHPVKKTAAKKAPKKKVAKKHPAPKPAA